MTGQFSEVSPERCNHYARFFQRITVAEANILFWLLFITNLILLSTCSIIHHKSIALSVESQKLPARISQSEKHKLAVRRQRVRYLALVSLCMAISVACTVVECFAALNIEYCQGEDLTNLYWSFWSITQVGSNIAIFGVMLQFWIVLGDVETPSWAVALGTPILVFAAVGFLIKELWKNTWARIFGKKEKNSGTVSELDDEDNQTTTEDYDEMEKGVRRCTSTAPTIVPEPDVRREGRNSSFWSRDLHYLMNSIIANHPLESYRNNRNDRREQNDTYGFRQLSLAQLEEARLEQIRLHNIRMEEIRMEEVRLQSSPSFNSDQGRDRPEHITIAI